jgi:methionyl aminopeptidase
MREGGKKLAEILRLLTTMTKAGVKTSEIDREAESRIRALGAEPAFKGYRAFDIPTPFPGSICISINDEIVHGMPYPERVIQEGDVVSIDIGMKYKGFYADTAYTVGVGKLSPAKQKLVETAKSALDVVLEYLEENIPVRRVTTSDIGALVQDYVEGAGFNVVRELVGHGVGKNLHEEPAVPNFRIKGKGDVLEPGTVVAIEPMIYEGEYGVITEKNTWPVKTVGGSAAHFEHTVAILEDGIMVLTQ